MADDKKKSYSVHKMYEVKGDKVEIKNKDCPKCGPGFHLAEHRGSARRNLPHHHPQRIIVVFFRYLCRLDRLGPEPELLER